MKKVVIIGPAYPLRGGIANFNEALCRTLNEKGTDCSIVSFTLQYPGFLFPGTTQLAGDDSPPPNLKITSAINSINPLSWMKAYRLVKNAHPDIVVFRYWIPFMAPCLGSIARLLKKNNRKLKVVAIADNIIPHEKRFGDRSLTSWFVNSIDSFIVMSKSVGEDLKQFDHNKPLVVQPHPVYDIFGDRVDRNIARARLHLNENDKVVLFFGFIRKYKGLDLLLQAFADERVRALNVKLLVAGEFYDDKQPYLDLINKLQIGDSVVLHDHYIAKNEVANYFSASDIVAQPYRDATQSGVTQIAYHFGKPMIVTNVGGLPEIVEAGKSGYVTNVDPTEIASAIVDFYSNNKQAALSAGSDELAKKFSWDNFAAAITRSIE